MTVMDWGCSWNLTGKQNVEVAEVEKYFTLVVFFPS